MSNCCGERARATGANAWRAKVPGLGGDGQARCAAGEQPAPSGKMAAVEQPRAEVYQLHNTVNGKLYIDSSVNIEGIRTSKLLQHMMSKAVFKAFLRHSWFCEDTAARALN